MVGKLENGRLAHWLRMMIDWYATLAQDNGNFTKTCCMMGRFCLRVADYSALLNPNIIEGETGRVLECTLK